MCRNIAIRRYRRKCSISDSPNWIQKKTQGTWIQYFNIVINAGEMQNFLNHSFSVPDHGGRKVEVWSGFSSITAHKYQVRSKASMCKWAEVESSNAPLRYILVSRVTRHWNTSYWSQFIRLVRSILPWGVDAIWYKTAASDNVESERRATKDNRLQFTEGLNAASIETHSSLTQKGAKSMEGAKQPCISLLSLFSCIAGGNLCVLTHYSLLQSQGLVHKERNGLAKDTPKHEWHKVQAFQQNSMFSVAPEIC